MKISEIKKLKLFKPETLNNIDVELRDVIEEEFFTDESNNNYRKSTVNKLIELTEEFSSDTNILMEMIKKLEMQIKCPYCKGTTNIIKGCGGNAFVSRMDLICSNCQSIVSFSLQSVSFSPSDTIKGKAVK